MQHLNAFAWRLVATFGSSLVLMFFSEFYFVNEGPARSVVDSMATGWSAWPISLYEQMFLAGFYFLFTYVFLITVDRFAVRTLAGLYLAGSLFGWATEATVIPAAHEAPPVSWFFTSASWHPLIDVVFGWYLIRLAMRRLPTLWLVILFVGTGAVWAYWSTWYWATPEESEFAPMTAVQFDHLVAVTGAAWIIGMILTDLGARRGFRASRPEVVIVGLGAFGLLLAMGVPFLPWSVGVWVLVCLTMVVLWRGKPGQMAHPDILAVLASPPRPATYLLALLMPLSAVLVYRLVLAQGVSAPTDMLVSFLFLGGTLAYAWSLWRVWRMG